MNSLLTKPIFATMILILLGLAAMVEGYKSLFVIIPAAMLVWYSASLKLRSGRN